nr:MAG TPA: hypothetical protein [Caudoviricetes sp.]DAU90641.1 MAG TPA: hypothetical protein [Bacteriophage sp.]
MSALRRLLLLPALKRRFAKRVRRVIMLIPYIALRPHSVDDHLVPTILPEIILGY